MRVWRWVKTYWYVPATILGILLVEICWPRGRSLARRIKAEIEAADAGARAKRWEAKWGADRARTRVEEVYHDELEKLETDQRHEAAELRGNPVALAKFLVRAGSL